MKDICEVFSISEKETRYHRLIEWIFAEVLDNRGSIFEQHGFSEKRTVRKNKKKLIGSVIFSKDPESSAFRGPSLTFRIFESRTNRKWRIDLFFKGVTKPPALQAERNLDFEKFINPARAEIIRKFIHE